jgi:hypothetical protein
VKKRGEERGEVSCRLTASTQESKKFMSETSEPCINDKELTIVQVG